MNPFLKLGNHQASLERFQAQLNSAPLPISLHNKDVSKNAASVERPQTKPTQMVRLEKMVKTTFYTIAIKHTQHVRLQGPEPRWSDIIMTMKEKQQRDSKQTRSVHIPNS